MNIAISRVSVLVLGATMGAAALSLAGCSGVSDLTKEHVARSETSVTQAQQTLGNSEAGALDLQHAKQNLDQARAALDKRNAKLADAYAQQAELDAQLAVAKSQTAAARKAADELMASIQTLKQEAQRTQPRTP
jgi:chromosome segregation ATPase